MNDILHKPISRFSTCSGYSHEIYLNALNMRPNANFLSFMVGAHLRVEFYLRGALVSMLPFSSVLLKWLDLKMLCFRKYQIWCLRNFYSILAWLVIWNSIFVWKSANCQHYDDNKNYEQYSLGYFWKDFYVFNANKTKYKGPKEIVFMKTLWL